jgi:hypothetical protein
MEPCFRKDSVAGGRTVMVTDELCWTAPKLFEPVTVNVRTYVPGVRDEDVDMLITVEPGTGTV